MKQFLSLSSSPATAAGSSLRSSRSQQPAFRRFVFWSLACSLCALVSAQVEVTSNGNVGIGTTVPANKLEINGGRVLIGDGTDSGWLFSGSSGGVTAFHIGSKTNVPLAFFTNSSAPHLMISTGGNVGIGTTSPGAGGGFSPRLQVSGAYGAVVIEATTPNKKWGLGVDSTGAFDIFETTANSYSGRFLITNGGNVGIGTTNPGHKLEVAGTVRATSFVSNTTTYADFVFKPGYRLAPLSEVEAHIEEHGHLPDIPSEAQVAKEGIDLAAMQVKLLQKIEELTLHVIRQEKENSGLRHSVEMVQQQLSKLSLKP